MYLVYSAYSVHARLGAGLKGSHEDFIVDKPLNMKNESERLFPGGFCRG